jgi:hypothetical protein
MPENRIRPHIVLSCAAAFAVALAMVLISCMGDGGKAAGMTEPDGGDAESGGAIDGSGSAVDAGASSNDGGGDASCSASGAGVDDGDASCSVDVPPDTARQVACGQDLCDYWEYGLHCCYPAECGPGHCAESGGGQPQFDICFGCTSSWGTAPCHLYNAVVTGQSCPKSISHDDTRDADTFSESDYFMYAKVDAATATQQLCANDTHCANLPAAVCVRATYRGRTIGVCEQP